MKPAVKFIVESPIEHTDNSYETARWYRSHTSDVGAFDGTLVAPEDTAREICFVVELPSTITAEDFSSSFGGVVYGGKNDRGVGERSSFAVKIPVGQFFNSRESTNKHAKQLRQVSSVALREIEKALEARAEGYADSLHNYMYNADEYTLGRTGGQSEMVAHCAEKLAELHRSLAGLRQYRERRYWFMRGRLSAKKGVSESPISRNSNYAAVSAWYDGHRFESKRQRATANA